MGGWFGWHWAKDHVIFFANLVSFVSSGGFGIFPRTKNAHLKQGLLWQIAIASGWESEGPVFKPWWLQTTFCQKITSDSHTKQCAFHE